MAGRQTTVRSQRASRGVDGAKGKTERAAPADRRELILAAAARRFAEYGFEATTVRQIADDVDILSGSLYHHFATKEEILEEIVRDAVQEQLDCAVRTAALPLNAEDRFVTLVVDLLRILTREPDAHAVVFHERRLFRRSPDFAHILKARKQTYDAWCSILEDGVKEGLFLPDLDIYLTITTAMRMLYSGADWYLHEDGSPIDVIASYSLEHLTQFYIGFILRSIRAPGRATDPIAQPVIDA
jgi:AcrR family transcriptional regulator